MVINSSKTLSLTGGGTDYVSVATGSDVAAALAANLTTKDLLQAQATSGNPVLQTGTGQLTGGNNPLFSNDVVELLTETPGFSDLVIVSGGNGNSGDVESVPLEPVTVQLSGSGANPKVETTVSQLVTLLNGNQTLLTATGSGAAKVMPLQRRALGQGWEPDVLTTTSEVVTLLSEDPQINDLITVTGGSPTEVAQTGSLQLSGGGLGFVLDSVPSGVIAAISSHSVASTLITATGSDTNAVGPLPRTVLRGGEPAILSTASDVVALLSGHSLVTATGSGSAILSPLERTYLSSTISKTTYTWNNQDRLTGVTTPDGTRHGYTYDYRARRVQTSRSNGPLPAQTTTLVFSGGLSLAEYESSTPGAITAHAPTVHYLRGPDMGGGVGGMLYSIRGSTLKYSLSNGRGDIVAQSDESAAITWTASYEAFGKRPAETGTNLDKQRANSKDEDPTGLLNEGFRYRDLETGAFISRDPAGFVDGPNLYAYVQQNPWTKFDPEGLFWSAIITAGFAAYDTYQYATGQMSGAEYAGAMALNGAALLADVATAGQGGGLAVRAANATIRVAKAVDKADTIYSTANGAIRTAEAIANGDGTGAVINGVLTAVGAKQSGGGGKAPDAPKADAPGGKSAQTTNAEAGQIADANVPSSNLSPTNYPNPDPSMNAPPVRYDPATNDELMRMRAGQGPTSKATHGDQNIEAHHRQQVPMSNGGVMDEITQQQHRGPGKHSRHSQPSQLTPKQRSSEIRNHWKQRGAEYVTDGEGI